MLDCLGEVVLVDTGFDDAVDGEGRDVPFRIFQLFEDSEGFGRPEWLLA